MNSTNNLKTASEIVQELHGRAAGDLIDLAGNNRLRLLSRPQRAEQRLLSAP